MITLFKETKTSIIISIISTVISMVLLMIVSFNNMNFDIWWTVAIILAAITALSAGGIKVVLRILMRTIHIGISIPCFPLNIVLGVFLIAAVGGFMALFPILIVILAKASE